MAKNIKLNNNIKKKILPQKTLKGEKTKFFSKDKNSEGQEKGLIAKEFNKYKKLKLRTQLIALFLVLSIIPCIGVNLYTNSQLALTMQDSMGISTQKLIEQAVYNLDAAINTITPTVNKISIDMDFKQLVNEGERLGVDKRLIVKNKVDSTIFSSFTLNRYIDGVITVSNQKVIYSMASNSSKLSQGLSSSKILENYLISTEFKESEAFKKIVEASSSRAMWFFINSGDLKRICVARKMNDSKDVNSAIISVFCINNDYYEEVLGKANIDSNIPILLVDDMNYIAFSNNKEIIGTKLTQYQVNLLADGIKKSGTSGTIATKMEVMSFGKSLNGWTLIMDAPMSILLKDMRQTTSQITVMLIVLIIIVIIISIVISQKIAEPIKMMAAYMGEIEKGNLSVEKEVRAKIKVSNAENRLLVDGFISMIATLRNLIHDAKEVTETVEQNTSALESVAVRTAQSAHDIEKAVDNVAQGAQVQSEQVEQSAELMEELSKAINDVMESISNIQEVSKATTDMSTNTMKKLENLTAQSKETVAISQDVSLQVKELGEEASNIGNILNLIKGINNQTNLLSLNAAIEAARAGESGKGFAVVADEVRKLSYQTQEAISSIEATISKIHTKKEETVVGLQKAIDVFDKQVPVVKETNETFTSIHTQMQNISEKIDRATVLLKQVVQQKNDVTLRMNEVAHVIEQAASVTEEVSAETIEQSEYAAQITKMANKLSETVDELKKAYNKFN